MSFYGKLQEWLAGPFTQKMQKFMQNPYMRALQTCFSTILPMIMVGSLASLINTFRNFWDWIPDLSLINSFSFGILLKQTMFKVSRKDCSNYQPQHQCNRHTSGANISGINYQIAIHELWICQRHQR